ncbi:MAG: PEP/pyruvate-binding domain-containing protein [Acidobacteriota bacterium]
MTAHAVLSLSLAAVLAGPVEVVKERRDQFLSFGIVPTWEGVVSDWKTSPEIHLYDSKVFVGHAEFVSRGLRTGITFRQFKDDVRDPASRQYVPFYLYDLRQAPVDVDGKKRFWALRLVSYQYHDTREEMAATVGKVLALVDAVMANAEGHRVDGLAILAKAPDIQPNMAVAPELLAAGFPSITESRLTELVKGRHVVVLNPGRATGTLRLVPAGRESDPLAQDDIAVFERTPDHVGPVAAIITLEPQTPLSHVNLLARNRGTINLYATSLDLLPGARALLGKRVELEARDGEVAIREADPAEASAVPAPRAVSVPEPDRGALGVVDLGADPPERLDVRVVGAKAANYARIQAGFPEHVRPGFAIPFGHYFRLADAVGATSLVERLAVERGTISHETRARLLAEIRARIAGGDAGTELFEELGALVARRFPGKRVRLRSSTNAEDLAGFNGAGLYESRGFGPGGHMVKLFIQLRQVYASLWTERACDERDLFGIDPRSVGMAVLVTEAFTGELANGVAITVPGPDGPTVVINVQKGGTVSVTNPTPGKTPESLVCGPGDAGCRIESSSSVAPVFEGHPELREILEEIREVALRVDRLLKDRLPPGQRADFGADVELRIVDGPRLWLKQARLLGRARPE